MHVKAIQKKTTTTTTKATYSTNYLMHIIKTYFIIN